MKIAALVGLAIGAAGCLQSNINGGANGSAGRSSGTPEMTTGASGAASSGGSGPSGTGPGASNGTSSGTGNGGAGPSGTGGSSSGGGSSTAGTTTGACLQFEEQNCHSNGECCSGACEGNCRQGNGHACLTDGDCSSNTCVNSSCECTSPSPQQQASCASDADCCNGIPCQVQDYPQYGQYGVCCNPIGGRCQGNWDCCDSNCVNGTCACLGVDSEGCLPGQCCTGQCVANANGGGVSACLSAPGDPCDGPWACANSHCVDGVCGTCSGATGGLCSTTADCCVGGICAENLVTSGGPFGFGGLAVDAGSACCAKTGSSCDGGENARACCSGACSGGLCTCARVTDECYNSESCCPGEACMTRASGGSGALACCQMEGQFCLAGYECCSGNCHNQTCACMPDGGYCGSGGFGGGAAEGPAACCSGICGDAGACL